MPDRGFDRNLRAWVSFVCLQRATRGETVPKGGGAKRGLSKPAASVYAHMRLTPEEKAKLEELAAECNVTLSYALREGARLYLEDLKRLLEEQKQRGLLPRPGGDASACGSVMPSTCISVTL